MKNRNKPLIIPAIVLWIGGGFIYFISTWYYGVSNNYRFIAYILIIIGFIMYMIEKYLFKKITKKQLLWFNFTFLILLVVSFLGINLFN
ncbi:hypothetical protein [Gottfriedia acidiceleris]|uniref:hypothetical protein n=1 Tax=Gottfriedia acidiceleris TaxID=371036 RepID=UPI0030001302